MRKIKFTLIALGFINLAFYAPGLVKEYFKECEKGQCLYSQRVHFESNGMVGVIFRDVTLSQHQIDSLIKIGKLD